MNFNFSRKKLDWIKEHCKLEQNELAAQFNLKFSDNKTGVQLHGVRKRHGWSTGRTGCFEKGNKPHNTGTKGLMKTNSGSFKKGHKPQNHLPIGSEIVNTQGYLMVKLEHPNKWIFKHRLIWEEKNGPIGKGELVRFKDGDLLNCCIENLELVTRQENAVLNIYGYSSLPTELKPTMKNIVGLQLKLTEKKRKMKKSERR